MASPAAEDRLRREIVRVGRIMYERGLTVANDGNISARLDDDRVVITPAGLCKGRLVEMDLLVTAVADGAVLAAPTGRRPSSETDIHLAVYRKFPEIGAVIHAHSPFLTALAVTGTPFPVDVLPEVILSLGDVPTTRLATPGTQDYLDSVAEGIAGRRGLILNHHGAMTVGPDLEAALITLERMEHTVHVTWIAKSFGNTEPLTTEIVADLQSRAHE
jgi:L-fuculose-phosphate aldolase